MTRSFPLQSPYSTKEAAKGIRGVPFCWQDSSGWHLLANTRWNKEQLGWQKSHMEEREREWQDETGHENEIGITLPLWIYCIIHPEILWSVYVGKYTSQTGQETYRRTQHGPSLINCHWQAPAATKSSPVHRPGRQQLACLLASQRLPATSFHQHFACHVRAEKDWIIIVYKNDYNERNTTHCQTYVFLFMYGERQRCPYVRWWHTPQEERCASSVCAIRTVGSTDLSCHLKPGYRVLTVIRTMWSWTLRTVSHHKIWHWIEDINQFYSFLRPARLHMCCSS